MYESFYGLTEKPFMLSPDSDFLYLGKSYKAALSRLEYVLVSHPGISVITGEFGTGKTTIVRKLLKKQDRLFTVGLISHSKTNSFSELMTWVLYAFDLPHSGKDMVEMYHVLIEFLIEQCAEERKVILIIDDAHNLSADCVEQLRILSNVNTDKNELLQLILVGENQLRDTLQLPELSGFLQRISVDCHIDNLTVGETAEFISHRIACSGGRVKLFTDQAVAAVWQASRGIPRVINSICDTAMLYGFADQKTEIDANLVSIVIRERDRGLSTVQPTKESTD